jgi:hypothetical protein
VTRPGASGLRWLLREVVVVGALAATVALVVAAALAYFLRWPDLVALIAVVALLVVVVRQRRLLRLDRVQPDAVPEVVTDDSALAVSPQRLNNLRTRVEWASVTARHYDSALRPVLANLADDRLLRHHGIDRRQRPDAAQQILGDQLWAALMTRRTTPVSRADLDTWLTALERLRAEVGGFEH